MIQEDIRNSLVRACLLPLWALVVTATWAQGTDSGRVEIVDRSIEFHGGETYGKSSSELRLCSKSGCYEVKARIEGGRFEVEAAGRVRDQERRVRIDNETVKLWLDGRRTEVEEDRSQALRNWVMARAYFVFLPFRLDDDSVIQRDLGLETWDGKALHKVKVSFLPGSSSGADDEFLYWFDPETARLEQFAYSFSGKPGGLRFRKAYNYRRVGGLLFFDQENWGVDSDGLSVDQIRPATPSGWELISKVTLQDIRVTPLQP